MTKKQIIDELSIIAKNDNDEVLNIPNWVEKIECELKYHNNYNIIAKINAIPVNIVEAIDHNMKQELEGE